MIMTFWLFKYPLFVKHYTQQALSLYNLRTVPVPYHINARLSENMEPSSYTWLHHKHQLLAMSYSTYVPLDIANIHNCSHFGNTYFCEQVFLTQHSTKHTCESAIYYESDIDMIKQLCNFTYYPSLIPEPTALDSGSKLLLANLPLPWTFFCTHEKQIPNDIEGASYVMLEKSDLCLCSITAGSLYLHENIVSCSHKTLRTLFK